MTAPRILVAGIGNIFLGDDAFGSEVAQRLLRRSWPPGVKVVDYGIRGLDLTYDLAAGCELAILIDAVPRGGEPGMLYVLEPEIGPTAENEASPPMIDGHSMDPVKVLQTAAAMGARPGRVIIIGCEPAPFVDDAEEMQMTLSRPVAAAVDEAVRLVESWVAKRLEDGAAQAAEIQNA